MTIPPGLASLDHRVPEPDEWILRDDGSLSQYVPGAIVQPQTVATLAPGYDVIYDIVSDRRVVAKIPPPFPQPEKGDWLDVALAYLATGLTVRAEHDRLEQIEPWTCERLMTGCTITLDGPKDIVIEVARAIDEIRGTLNRSGQKIVTFTPLLPVAAPEARWATNPASGVCMRYIRGRDRDHWIMRFDVFYAVKEAASAA